MIHIFFMNGKRLSESHAKKPFSGKLCGVSDDVIPSSPVPLYQSTREVTLHSLSHCPIQFA
jgi:hypothetical protein